MFDTFGFSGHQCYGSLIEAVEEMIKQGYHIKDVGALDPISLTPRWAEGTDEFHSRFPLWGPIPIGDMGSFFVRPTSGCLLPYEALELTWKQCRSRFPLVR
jgi:hypothetical protein